MYTRAFFFKTHYQPYIGRIQSTEILITSRAIRSEESPDTTGYIGSITTKILSLSGRTPALFILFILTSRANPLNVKMTLSVTKRVCERPLKRSLQHTCLCSYLALSSNAKLDLSLGCCSKHGILLRTMQFPSNPMHLQLVGLPFCTQK